MAKDFSFKQFHIQAGQCGMPVSTDAVLLGAWAKVTTANNILDIGCGTGLLAIMSAQRNASANIFAVEIEKNAYLAAKNNFILSPWSDRLTVVHAAIQDYAKQMSHSVTNESLKFDAIICNPPYFNNGQLSSNNERALARHTHTLSHQSLLDCCSRLLKPQGTLSLILPKSEGEALLALTQSMALQATRLTYVKTTSTKGVTRLLIELTQQAIKSDTIMDELIINQGNGYTKEFTALTRAFYLKM